MRDVYGGGGAPGRNTKTYENNSEHVSDAAAVRARSKKSADTRQRRGAGSPIDGTCTDRVGDHHL